MFLDIVLASRKLKNHGVVSFPTETVMGLGVKYDDLTAYKLLNKIKCRQPDKPYSLMLSNIDDIYKYAEINNEIDKVIKTFLPGPLTLLLKAKNILPEWCYKDDVVGIRVPDHKICQRLIKKTKSPLLVPSANRSGEKPATNSKEVKYIFKNELDYIVHGKSGGELASTILDMSKKPYRIVREGVISKKDLQKIVEVY